MVMPAFPYLAPWYRIAAGDEEVVLEYGQRITCLAGRAGAVLIPVLLPLLDGTRTIDEIVEVLASVWSGGPSLVDAASSLRSRSVVLVGSGQGAVEVARLLRQSGVAVERDETVATGVDLVVCAPAPAELPMLGSWNRQALAAVQPWLQVLPYDGRYAAIGPLYLPDETCCYECFRLRRSANLDAGDELLLLEAAPAPYPVPPAVHALTAGIAATLALEWLVLRDPQIPSAFYAVELVPALAMSLHHVHRVPRCRACSGLDDVAAPLPWHKETAVVGG
jgi:bacteriocin biosynthesis cyclodehydratase domain-containing protein